MYIGHEKKIIQKFQGRKVIFFLLSFIIAANKDSEGDTQRRTIYPESFMS